MIKPDPNQDPLASSPLDRWFRDHERETSCMLLLSGCAHGGRS